MIHIKPINAFNDNYIWAIIDSQNKQAIVVDPGQADPVLEFLKHHQLQLSGIWITHKHYDHIGGVKSLLTAFPNIDIVANKQHETVPNILVDEGSSFMAFRHKVTVWKTPGHTENHLVYLYDIKTDEAHSQRHVFCGDTLFSGGCGRVFTGDMLAMHQSLSRLANLDDASLFYPAHEYTASNLKFGQYIEPENQAIKEHLLWVNEQVANRKASLPSSLQQEKQINVFLRTDKAGIQKAIQQKGFDANMPSSVFGALRQLKDNF